MDAIQISHLKKYYSDIKAVDDISFSVKKGDLFGLLGVNGAGKSTTIHILCTLLKATAGTVKICDYDALKEANAIRNKIGVVFQNNTLDDYLTVKENLLMRGFLYEKDLKTVQKNLYEIAEILNIQNLLSRPFRKLSGGQKRRCEIARALMNTPEILFQHKLQEKNECHSICIQRYGVSYEKSGNSGTRVNSGVYKKPIGRFRK